MLNGRNLEMTITIEYIWDLFLQQNRKCALSGVDLLLWKYAKDTNANASLDRIDNTKGYIINNIQWIHKTINKMKTDLKQQEFLDFCIIIGKHQEKNVKN